MKRFVLLVLLPLMVICAPGKLKNVCARNTSNAASEVKMPPTVNNEIPQSQNQIPTKESKKKETVPVISNGNNNVKNIVYDVKNMVYVIKAGSYTNRAYADSELIRIKEMGFNCYVDIVLRKGKTLYVLKVGDFTAREEAKKAQNMLRQKIPELKAYIMRENSDRVRTSVNDHTELQQQNEKKVVLQNRSPGSESINSNTVSKAIPEKGIIMSSEESGNHNNVPLGSTDKKVRQRHQYVINAGSYKNRDNADRESRQLKEMGFASYVQPVVHDGETWYRLKVGDFSSREEAAKTERQLVQKVPEIKSYIVKEQPEPIIEKGSQKNAYSLQVGSHINLAYAENDLKQLKEMGFEGYVQPVVHEEETWYRLKVGDFSSREEAAGAEKQLAQKLPELNSYIVEEELDAKERNEIKPSIVAEELDSKERDEVNPSVVAQETNSESEAKRKDRACNFRNGEN